MVHDDWLFIPGDGVEQRHRHKVKTKQNMCVCRYKQGVFLKHILGSRRWGWRQGQGPDHVGPCGLRTLVRVSAADLGETEAFSAKEG